MKKVKVAIIGCGNISDIYITNLKKFDNTDLVCCADLNVPAAAEKAQKHSIKHCLVDEVFGDKDISIIVNLTPPAAHYDVARKSLKSGKSVYNEKPLCIELEQADELVKIAEEKGLKLGGAPDTFMGAGIQTCRKLIDDGAIGKPLSFTAFMMSHGVETWHPNPEFYYQWGGGPLFDMGPYYLTALVNLIGGFDYVQSTTTKGFEQRKITSQPKNGKIIDIEVPTHINGLLVSKSGAAGVLITSFDVWKHTMPFIEIHGTEGSLKVPDPNFFGGEVKLFKAGASEWEIVPLVQGYPENSRGLGVSDMAKSITEGGSFRADNRITYHVLETMHALIKAGKDKCAVAIKSQCDKPAKFY